MNEPAAVPPEVPVEAPPRPEPRWRLVSRTREQIVIPVEVETALFMRGHQRYRRGDLRSSSIRGYLRWWFRALAGAYLDPSALRTVESALFGAQQQPGKVQLVVSRGQRSKEDKFSLALPHKDAPAQQMPLPALAVGTRATITLVSHGASREEFAAVKGALWCALWLGSFGTRARRGAGTITPRLPSEKGFVFNETTLDNLPGFLAEGLATARRAVATLCGSSIERETAPEFPQIRSSASFVFVTPIDGASEEEARKNLMMVLRRFKSPAFGIPYRVENGGWVKSSAPRFPSPLWFRVGKLGESFVVTATFLPPLPPVEELTGEAIERLRRYFSSAREVTIA